MYPVLQRMLEEGWLADGWEDHAQTGRAKRPPRRYYELTDAGKAALGAVIAEARRDTRFAPLKICNGGGYGRATWRACWSRASRWIARDSDTGTVVTRRGQPTTA